MLTSGTKNDFVFPVYEIDYANGSPASEPQERDYKKQPVPPNIVTNEGYFYDFTRCVVKQWVVALFPLWTSLTGQCEPIRTVAVTDTRLACPTALLRANLEVSFEPRFTRRYSSTVRSYVVRLAEIHKV